MSRVKNSVATRARRKRVLKLAKGYFGRKSTVYKTANQAVIKSAMYAYRDRRNNKRNFRKLWLQESMLLLEAMGCLIVLSCMRSEQKESNLIERF